MVLAIHRELTVDAPLEAAWHHFARAGDWPTWHTDLKSVEVVPPGELGPTSVATLQPHKGPATIFRMREFDPYRHWSWDAKMLWCGLFYDHRFEAVGARRTRIVLHIEVSGFGAALFARVVAAFGNRSLDKGLPRLVREMRDLGARA